MLKQRIITALVLLAILIPSVSYHDPIAFVVVSAILIAAAAWEWARMNSLGKAHSLSFGALCGVLCMLSWVQGLSWMNLPLLWVCLSIMWIIAGGILLSRGVGAWQKVGAMVRLAGGFIALWGAWLAVIKAREIGLNFLFSVLVLVWAADVFAYFAGRALGGRFISKKLAPSISPGKTWEGALGGLVGVLLIAFAWMWVDVNYKLDSTSIYSLMAHVNSVYMHLGVILMWAMSIVGDLLESLFKRSAGIKDSSNLLPGHGGVLDRVDALLPVLPLAMMLGAM